MQIRTTSSLQGGGAQTKYYIMLLLILPDFPIDIISDINWETFEKGVWLKHDLETFPLLMKTDTEAGTYQYSKISFTTDTQEKLGEILIDFQSTLCHVCGDNWRTFSNLPSEPNKVWNITKTSTAITIECNDVVVVNAPFSNSEWCKSMWKENDVAYIRFKIADTATDRYIPMPKGL